jgi:hypothetical protein
VHTAPTRLGSWPFLRHWRVCMTARWAALVCVYSVDVALSGICLLQCSEYRVMGLDVSCPSGCARCIWHLSRVCAAGFPKSSLCLLHSRMNEPCSLCSCNNHSYCYRFYVSSLFFVSDVKWTARSSYTFQWTTHAFDLVYGAFFVFIYLCVALLFFYWIPGQPRTLLQLKPVGMLTINLFLT